MTETVSTTTLAITFDELLAAVFPQDGFLRLVADNGDDAFYRRHADGRWLVLGQERAGLDAFIVTHSTGHVAFSPVSWRALAINSPMVACACLWAGIRYALRSQRPHEPRSRVLEGERERAEARLGGIERPSVLIDEGHRMVAFWRLASPLTDPSQVRSLLERLARHVGGDRELTDPATALVAIPGTRNDNVYPSRVVTITAAATGDSPSATPRGWTLEEIEHATAPGGRS